MPRDPPGAMDCDAMLMSRFLNIVETDHVAAQYKHAHGEIGLNREYAMLPKSCHWTLVGAFP
jgi:hypothetical protein